MKMRMKISMLMMLICLDRTSTPKEELQLEISAFERTLQKYEYTALMFRFQLNFTEWYHLQLLRPQMKWLQLVYASRVQT